MKTVNNETVLINKLRNLFKKERVVSKNDIGIYHYVWSCDTSNEISYERTYDIFLKVKATEVYDDLVEIEIMDTNITDAASQDVINIIKTTLPKYINPSSINWLVKLVPI